MPGQTSRSDKLYHSLWVLLSLNQFHPLWSSLLTWYDDSKANRLRVSRQCMNEKIRWNMNMVFSFFVSQINKNNIGKLAPQSKKDYFWALWILMKMCGPILFKFKRIERISLFRFSPATPTISLLDFIYILFKSKTVTMAAEVVWIYLKGGSQRD